MKIIIVGAGTIGKSLAQSLSKEDNEVYLIESNEELASKVDEKLDVKVLVGSGIDPDILKLANVSIADLVIAVTYSDETNFTICSLASLLGAKRLIARIRNIALSNLIHKRLLDPPINFPIDEIINPEEVTAKAIVKIVETPGAREVGDFVNGQILLRSFDVKKDSSLCGVKLGDLRSDKFPWPFLIVAINREKEVIIPKGDTVIKESDRIYVLLPEASLREFLFFIHERTKKASKVIVYGATSTGSSIVQYLQKEVSEVVLLEEDKHKSEDIAGKFKKARIINGTASEKDILIEAGVEVADIFVAASNDDHSNLISAVLAKEMGAKTTIITMQKPDYLMIIDELDIDVIINPHLLAVEQILGYVRGKSISSVTKLLECDAEVLEFIAEPGSNITKKPLKNIRFPKNAIVGAISRGDEVILGQGDTVVQVGDKVVIFCQELAIKKVQGFF